MKMRYVIYGLSGICMEVLWTALGSLLNNDYHLIGRTNLWMFFIYGLAIFLEPIHNFLRNYNIFLRGGVYAVLIFITEYSTGLFLQALLGSCPWYYTDSLSFHGLITFSYIPAWFVVGLLFEKLHDLLTKLYIKY